MIIPTISNAIYAVGGAVAAVTSTKVYAYVATKVAAAKALLAAAEAKVAADAAAVVKKV